MGIECARSWNIKIGQGSNVIIQYFRRKVEYLSQRNRLYDVMVNRQKFPAVLYDMVCVHMDINYYLL